MITTVSIMLICMTVQISEDHSKLAELLNKHNIVVLATTGTDLKPHVATVYSIFLQTQILIFTL